MQLSSINTCFSRIFFLFVFTLVPLLSIHGQDISISSDSQKRRSDQAAVVWSMPVTETELSMFERRHSGIEAKSSLSSGAQSSQSASTQQKNGYVFPSSRERLNRYIRGMVGPSTLLEAAAAAALEQWHDSPDEWGQGAQGYGKRFASSLGSNAIQETVTYGLSEAFHLDTHFEKSKRKGFMSRLEDALVQNVTSRTRSGKRVISAPILAGTYASTIIPTETWYPRRYNYKDGLRGGTYVLLFGFGVNVVREFVFNW